MDNFIYKNQTKIIFGKETHKTIGAEIAQHYKKVLLHYGGGSIKKSGLYDDVITSLKDANITYIELFGVVPNPVLSLVNEGIALCRNHDIELVLAVGGGSVIDSAKAIAAGAVYDGDVWDFFSGKAKVQNTLPVGTILTIPAAGSENSVSCVITNQKENLKKGTMVPRPVFSILNPELTYTLPAYQSAAGAVDIMAHVMERYFTPTRDVDFTDKLCEAVMETVIENAYTTVSDPTNYDARAQMMWASTIAHNGLLNTGRVGDWASHHIQHAMGGFYNMSHGAGLAVIFPAWMKYVYKHDIKRFVKFAVRVWNVNFENRDFEDIALEGITRYESFLKTIGMPTRLNELDVPADRFSEMAEICAPDGTFARLEARDIVEIFKLAQ